jgi:hypothetical protein
MLDCNYFSLHGSTDGSGITDGASTAFRTRYKKF